MTTVELLSALTSDYLSASGYALSSVSGLATGKLLEAMFRKRAENARDLLVAELRLGSRTEYDIEPEEAVAVMFRYFRAATEGTARLNLGIMAAFIAGQTRREELRSDLFMTWADVIATLRRGEVHLLGAIQAVLSEPKALDAEATQIVRDNYIHDRVNALMLEAGYPYIETYSLYTSLSRTGCFSFAPTMSTINFRPTPIFHEIASLVDIDGVISRHG